MIRWDVIVRPWRFYFALSKKYFFKCKNTKLRRCAWGAVVCQSYFLTNSCWTQCTVQTQASQRFSWWHCLDCISELACMVTRQPYEQHSFKNILFLLFLRSLANVYMYVFLLRVFGMNLFFNISTWFISVITTFCMNLTLSGNILISVTMKGTLLLTTDCTSFITLDYHVISF